jgi:hypothetical protein
LLHQLPQLDLLSGGEQGVTPNVVQVAGYGGLFVFAGHD